MAVNSLDKYFTPDWLVKKTIDKAIELFGLENIKRVIEPSAGDGAFIPYIEEKFPHAEKLYYDLYPEHPKVVKTNFFNLRIGYEPGTLIIGNPPFGNGSHLWKGFCYKAAKLGDMICFISPASQWNSNYYFHDGELIYSEYLEDVHYRGSDNHNGKDTPVRTCLNAYRVVERVKREFLNEENKIEFIDFRVRNNEPLKKIKCDYYLSSSFSNIGEWDEKPLSQNNIGIIIKDESIRPKLIEFLNKIKNNKEKYFVHGTMYKESLRLLDIQNLFKEFLNEENNLDNDLSIEPNGDNKQADFYMSRWGAGCVLKIEKYPKWKDPYVIIIKNESKREQIEKILYSLRNKYYDEIVKTSVGPPMVSLYKLKEILYKELYEKQELSDIVEFEFLDHRNEKYHKSNYEFYMCSLGTVGKLCNKGDYSNIIGIDIIDESKREIIEEFLRTFRDKYTDDLLKLCQGTPCISSYFFKEKLEELFNIKKKNELKEPKKRQLQLF